MMGRPLEISGAECVSALVLSGCRVATRAKGSTSLTKGRHVIIVPDSLVLAPAVLEAVLTRAELSCEQFVALIAEEPTLPGNAS